MANDRKHSPWRKSVLIPFWCIQIFFMLLFIALLGLALGVLDTYENNNDEDWDNTQFDNVSDPEHVVHVATDLIVPVWITICVICLVLTITEIILLARQKLRPLAFLIMNVIKTAIWTTLFILDIVSAVTEGGRTVSVVGIIIDVILLYVSPPPSSMHPTNVLRRLSFWTPLIYSSVIYHRFRHEQKSYKPVDHPYSVPINTSYESQFPKAYATPETHSDLESNMGTTNVGGRARGVSFNHERDTRYDTYRKSGFSPETPALETFESRVVVAGGGIPQVYVENLDRETYEMEGRRELR